MYGENLMKHARPKPKQTGSTVLEGQQYYTKLFALEKELAKLTPEERYEQRLKQKKPVLDVLLTVSDKKCTAKICSWKSTALFAGTVAVSDSLFGG